MDKEQKEITICKECENGYLYKSFTAGIFVRCKKTEEKTIDYKSGDEWFKYFPEKQDKWNELGKCVHYKKRIQPIELKEEIKEPNFFNFGPNIVVKSDPLSIKKPWYKKLFRLK